MSKRKENAPVVKNQEVVISIVDLGSKGEGIGRYENFPIFVEGALPGEEVRVKILQVRSSLAYGKILEILAVSPDRVESACPWAGKCGGCQLAHLSYDGQLRYKQNKIAQVLRRIGGFEDVEVPPLRGMTGGWEHYRNKAQFPVQMVEEKATAGFYAPRSHRLLPVENCLIQSEIANKMIAKIMDFVRKQNISIYDEETHQGLLRHILVRDGRATGQISVCLVINGTRLPQQEAWLAFMQEQGVQSFSININREKGNVILGTKTVLVAGTMYIEDKIGELSFFISPQSFYQVNPVQTRVLYETALEMADLQGEETVIDAYCGIGTISLFLAQKAKKVYGVEIVEGAIRDAQYNAQHNGMNNAEFICGKAEEVIPALYRERGIRADVMVVDPPRAGCDEALLETMVQMAPERIVYVSCDPATLARDLNYLCHSKGAYELKKVQGVCMFPATAHVETVCLLSKLNTTYRD